MADNLGQLFLEIALENPRALKSIRGARPGTSLSPISKGNIIQFRYDFARPGHDLNPLVLITDDRYTTKNSPLVYIRGINLHRLYTSSDVLRLISPSQMNACGNPFFSYDNIKPFKYIRQAFRMYKTNGVKRVKLLDCEYLKRVIAASRKLNTQDLNAIRSFINVQLQKSINPSARNLGS
jgi:hypothetical protein